MLGMENFFAFCDLKQCGNLEEITQENLKLPVLVLLLLAVHTIFLYGDLVNNGCSPSLSCSLPLSQQLLLNAS